MPTKRIAVTASGSKYIVQRVDFRTDTVHVWGEVHGANGLSTKHGASLSFPLSSVSLTEVEFTPSFVHSLFDQAVAAKRAAGAVITMHGRKHVTAIIH